NATHLSQSPADRKPADGSNPEDEKRRPGRRKPEWKRRPLLPFRVNLKGLPEPERQKQRPDPEEGQAVNEPPRNPNKPEHGDDQASEDRSIDEHPLRIANDDLEQLLFNALFLRWTEAKRFEMKGQQKLPIRN